MTQEEEDVAEFENWLWDVTSNAEKIWDDKIAQEDKAEIVWLASRRTLREKEAKWWRDVTQFYNDPEEDIYTEQDGRPLKEGKDE